MEFLFTFLGGPRDGEKMLLDVSAFPMYLPGGRYLWNGLSHAVPHNPTKQFPEPDYATAVWTPND